MTDTQSTAPNKPARTKASTPSDRDNSPQDAGDDERLPPNVRPGTVVELPNGLVMESF